MIEDIPRSFLYKCDAHGCKVEHLQRGEILNGHYINSTPPDWTTLRVALHGYGVREALFCPVHALEIVSYLRDQQGWKGLPKTMTYVPEGRDE